MLIMTSIIMIWYYYNIILLWKYIIVILYYHDIMIFYYVDMIVILHGIIIIYDMIIPVIDIVYCIGSTCSQDLWQIVAGSVV